MGRGRRWLLLLFAVYIAALAQTPIASAQAPEDVRVTVRVEENGLTVGDPITIVVSVQIPAGTTITIDPDPRPLGNLEPATPRLVERVESESGTRIVYVYDSRAFFSGRLRVEVPPFLFTDVAAATNTLVQPAPIEIEIESVLPANQEDLEPRPLKPAEALTDDGAALAPILGAIGGVVALCAVALAIQRRRARPAIVPAAANRPDPVELATKALRQIDEDGLLPERLDEYCMRINETVRAYLRDRYRIPADSLTTHELPGRLARAGADPSTARTVASLCAECDAVAYARARPETDRAARYLDLGMAIIGGGGASAASRAEARWGRPEAQDQDGAG